MTKVLSVIQKSLPCQLTDDELRQAGADLAAAVQDTATEEKRQTDVKAQMKAKLTELQSRQTQLSIKVSRREEYRDVRVEVRLGDDSNVREVRIDTGEVISTRLAHDYELQTKLTDV